MKEYTTKGTKADDGQRRFLQPEVEEVLKSSGQPLHPTTLSSARHRFGRDFRDVRVHPDGNAAKAAKAVDAVAFTSGEHIVFGDGRYQPFSPEGERLLAHELVHVVQQSAGPKRIGILGPPNDSTEQEATHSAVDATAGKQVPIGTPHSLPLIQRDTVPWSFPIAQPQPNLRLDWKTFQKVEAEIRAPIFKWLGANINTVRALALDDVVRMVQKSVPKAMGMDSGSVAAAVSSWAADNNVALPRISALTGSAVPTQQVPAAQRKSRFEFSPYSMGMVGLHLEVNPTSEPDLATILAPYREHGIAIDNKLIQDVTTNYDLGIQELEELLKRTGVAGSPETVHKAAQWLAKKLLTQTMTVSATQQQPTASESLEAERQKILQVSGAPQPSLLQSTPVGASLTIHFDFLGSK